jgi:hypothetical protein
MTKVEAELVKFAKVKQIADDFDDHQGWLTAVIKAVSKAADKDPDGYDEISIEAADWYGEAVIAHNQHDVIPDFPDADEAEELEFEDDEPEAEDEKAPDEDDDEEEAEEAAADTAEAEAANEQDEASAHADVSEHVTSELQAEGPVKKGKKQAAKSKPAKKPKAEAVKKDKKPEARTYPTVQRNRYNVTVGTKTHDALMMYESGKYTRGEVSDKLGGKYYNCLRDAVKNGHTVELSPDDKVKLTHKDDVGKKAKPKAKGKAKEEGSGIMDIDSDVAD